MLIYYWIQFIIIKVNDIRDDIQYYVDNHEEDDFIEDDGIYDELNLTRAEYYGLNNDDDKDSMYYFIM